MSQYVNTIYFVNGILRSIHRERAKQWPIVPYDQMVSTAVHDETETTKNDADMNSFIRSSQADLFRVKLFCRHRKLFERRWGLVEEELAQFSGPARQTYKPRCRRRYPRQFRLEVGGVVKHQVAGVSEPHRFGLDVHLSPSRQRRETIVENTARPREHTNYIWSRYLPGLGYTRFLYRTSRRRDGAKQPHLVLGLRSCIHVVAEERNGQAMTMTLGFCLLEGEIVTDCSLE